MQVTYTYNFYIDFFKSFQSLFTIPVLFSKMFMLILTECIDLMVVLFRCICMFDQIDTNHLDK